MPMTDEQKAAAAEKRRKTAEAKKDAAKKSGPTAKADNAAPPPAQSKGDALFALAVAFVLKERIEGGYVNDPRDPGGETKFGISKRSYPKLKIAELTEADAIAIYKRDFWDAGQCEKFPAIIAIAMFDAAINQGPGIAVGLLQRALGVKRDKIIGPVTLGAAHNADPDMLLIEFLSWRLRRYAFTGNASTYMRGWSVRVLLLQRFLIEHGEEIAA